MFCFPVKNSVTSKLQRVKINRQKALLKTIAWWQKIKNKKAS